MFGTAEGVRESWYKFTHPFVTILMLKNSPSNHWTVSTTIMKIVGDYCRYCIHVCVPTLLKIMAFAWDFYSPVFIYCTTNSLGSWVSWTSKFG